MSVYVYDVDLDISQQRKNALFARDYLVNESGFSDKDAAYSKHKGDLDLPTKIYNKYNYATFPLPGMPKLYDAIRDAFAKSLASENDTSHTEYAIQIWVNFYNKGSNIDWHHHWSREFDSWHGFYCVDTEPNSHTEYAFYSNEKDAIRNMLVESDDERDIEFFLGAADEHIFVKSKDNRIVISRSGNDCHRSSEWEGNRPRVTVAFDIVPIEKMPCCGENIINHYLPITIDR